MKIRHHSKSHPRPNTRSGNRAGETTAEEGDEDTPKKDGEILDTGGIYRESKLSEVHRQQMAN